MSYNDFVDLIAAFCKRPTVSTEGRHVYLWHGDLNKLKTIIPVRCHSVLDLYQLAKSLERTPRANDEARRLLNKVLKEKLSDALVENRQHVLIVIGCDLLSRYSIPLKMFFEVSSETVMVIFVVSNLESKFKPNEVLPDYISLNPTSTLAYIKDVLGENATIEASMETL
jgi:hypothetical protein